MRKGIIWLPILIIVLLVSGVGFAGFKYLQRKPTIPTPTMSPNLQPSSQETQAISPTIELTHTTVPLLKEEDVIRTFFELINEHHINDAVMMMSQVNISNNSTKQAWGVQFNAIKSINIQKIEASMPENWTDYKHVYKTTLETYVSSEAANAPIPYYGWQDNPNIRWVVIVKEADIWKIDGLATSP